MKEFLLVLTLFISYFGVSTLSAQRKITTSSGQHLALMPDGTWFKTEATPMLIDSIVNDVDSLDMIRSDANPLQDPSKVVDEKTKEAIKILVEAAELNEIKSFISLDSLYLSKSTKDVRLSNARITKNKVQEKLAKKEITDLNNEIKKFEKKYENAAKIVFDTRTLSDTKTDEQAQKILALGRELNVDVSPYVNLPASAEIKPQKTNVKLKDNCGILRDERINKDRIVETSYQKLFSYTPEKLKRYFKEKDLMEVSSSITQIGKSQYLKLKIRLLSKDAARNYGSIVRGNMLKISLISGKTIILYSESDVQSYVENYTGHHIYDAKYLISGDDAGLLNNVPSDVLGIMWSTGYESYDIYNVDTLMSQMSCIKSVY
ncbi:MAG: hypothetical protein IPL08_01300 [Saprospiraceae bacterium]|nr:hypothetical protein [Saprospiraceae bacterium]